MHLELVVAELQRIARIHGHPIEQSKLREWLGAIAPQKEVDRAIALVEARGALGAELRQASSIEPKTVQWLWINRIPIGMLTMLVGDPGVGKSYVSLDIAARVSRGTEWPDRAPSSLAGRVLLLSAEDDPECTIVPRLKLMGAYEPNIYVVGNVLRGGKSKWWELPMDMSALESVMLDVEPTLVVIDPITAYMGSADANSSAPVREIMTQLNQLAAQCSSAVLVISHFSKASRDNAMYRVMGSLSFIAAARMGWGVVKDPENPGWRLMIACKHNIVERPTGLSYMVRDGCVTWSDEVVQETIEAFANMRQTNAGSEAEQWLRTNFCGQCISLKELLTSAKDAGFTQRTLQRALAACASWDRKKDGTYWSVHDSVS